MFFFLSSCTWKKKHDAARGVGNNNTTCIFRYEYVCVYIYIDNRFSTTITSLFDLTTIILTENKTRKESFVTYAFFFFFFYTQMSISKQWKNLRRYTNHHASLEQVRTTTYNGNSCVQYFTIVHYTIILYTSVHIIVVIVWSNRSYRELKIFQYTQTAK